MFGSPILDTIMFALSRYEFTFARFHVHWQDVASVASADEATDSVDTFAVVANSTLGTLIDICESKRW